VKRLFINGRFLGQRVTGVQRFGREILRHLDRLLRDVSPLQGPLDVTVLTPRGTDPGMDLQAIRVAEMGRLQGHFWEQLELAREVGKDMLLNLCNTGPLTTRKMITTIYDASVFTTPEAYSRGFRLWYRVLLPAIGRRSVRVITASRFSRSELQRYAGIPLQAIVVIPGSGEHILAVAPDEEIFRRIGLQPQRYVLAVNSHSPHKNTAALCRAASLLKQSDYDIVLAGGTNTRVFGAHSGLDDGRLRVTGYVTDHELRALYQHATCFVYPSRYEGFGLPPLEAMTCGCPVIVSRAASLPEVCGDAAIYCDPTNPADIARAMDQVLGDPQLQEELRGRSLERSRRFSWSRAAQEMLELIQDPAA
jgi:glycosyltransferase involved in cell wall biosynthesis